MMKQLLEKELPAIEGGIPIRKNYLNFSQPLIGEEEIREVVDTLRSGWLGTGPKTIRFANEFREYIGSRFAIPTNSCTSALHLSLVACGVNSGDEVITTPMTFVATVNVIVHQGAIPVFADILPNSFHIDPQQIERKITKRTKAIIPVHFGGLPCDMDAIMNIARKHHLYVIEDAAHAVGGQYKGKKIGTIGDFTCFSFYVTKNMTTAEGGMVTTDEEEKAKMIDQMSRHGIDLDPWQRHSNREFKYYEVVYPGYKYNMTDLAASMGLHQLKKMDEFLESRRRCVGMYGRQLQNLSEVVLPRAPVDGEHAWHLYPILVKPECLKITRDQFVEALCKENVGVGVHYRAIHLQKYYRERFHYERGNYPNAEFVSDRVLSLPLSSGMSDEDVQDTVEAVRKLIRYYRK